MSDSVIGYHSPPSRCSSMKVPSRTSSDVFTVIAVRLVSCSLTIRVLIVVSNFAVITSHVIDSGTLTIWQMVADFNSNVITFHAIDSGT